MVRGQGALAGEEVDQLVEMYHAVVFEAFTAG
jgi:hypothetical protein